MKLLLRTTRIAVCIALAFLITRCAGSKECDPTPAPPFPPCEPTPVEKPVQATEPSKEEIEQIKAEILELRKQIKARDDAQRKLGEARPAPTLEQLAERIQKPSDGVVQLRLFTLFSAHSLAEIAAWLSGPVTAIRFDDTMRIAPFMASHGVEYPFESYRVYPIHARPDWSTLPEATTKELLAAPNAQLIQKRDALRTPSEFLKPEEASLQFNLQLMLLYRVRIGMERDEVRRILGTPELADDDVDYFSPRPRYRYPLDVWKPSFEIRKNSLDAALSLRKVHGMGYRLSPEPPPEISFHRVYYSNNRVIEVVAAGGRPYDEPPKSRVPYVIEFGGPTRF